MPERIDPHVHCRDGKQSYKETIIHVLKLMDEQGVEIVFDMPNTDPPILKREDVEKRLVFIPKEGRGRYFLYLGLTPEQKQIKETFCCYEDYPQVIGFKLYAGESVGNLGITDPEKQKRIYLILTGLNYTGVVVAHCERVDYFKPELWNPNQPITHCFARPAISEIKAIEDQIKFVMETGFEGHLHIAHVSSPKSVEVINEAKRHINISCGVTPHHIMWTKKMLQRPDGLLYKMNPPLRDKKDLVRLREQLKKGLINWIETDHAPHSVGEKFFPPYASGFPSLYLYRMFVEQFLPSLGFLEEEIIKLTSDNIRQVFSSKLK